MVLPKSTVWSWMLTGAVVPGARVHIQRIEDKSSRNTIADATGKFSFAALPPGRYRVQVELAGLEPAFERFLAAPGDRGILSATLQVGTVSETVEVTGQAIQVMANNAAVTMVAPRALNGRNVMELSELQSANKTRERGEGER